SLLR
ncbi:hypothetical protein D030_1273B, partial [Vibrio parahaemolyticus AQ3810]